MKRADLLDDGQKMAVAAPPATFTAKVCSVRSGDSLTVIDVTNRHHPIHLRGVDAPEPQQDFGSEARKGLVDLVFGKTVWGQLTGQRSFSRSPSVGIEEEGTGVREGVALHPRRKKGGIPCSKPTKRPVQAHRDPVC
jgi:hypothetical protein